MTIRGDVHNVLSYSGTTDAGQAVGWLTAANAVVDSQLTGSGLAESTLARIEEHLAAHYIETGGGREVTSERLPDYAVTYARGSLGGLGMTRNGQIAQLLDTTGALGESAKPKPSFVVLGPE